MTFNQLFHFIDNLDPSLKHMVMFYEEPEYARLVQIRFLNHGLRNGECCVYVAPDDDLIRPEMMDWGIDVGNYEKQGLLQFHTQQLFMNGIESYERTVSELQKTVRDTFFAAQGKSTSTLPRVRGIGSTFRDTFIAKEGENNSNKNNNSNRAQMLAIQPLVERLIQSRGSGELEGVWMCTYQVDSISEALNKEWMAQVLDSHEAALLLPKLSNGVALDLRK